MVTADLMVELLRRFVLLEDETVVWSKAFPDGPQVDVETTDRVFSIRVVTDWLRIAQAPWVSAVVLVTREDLAVEGAPTRHTFLVQADGTERRLEDPAEAAALGMRLHRGELDVAAYAELLVRCQWPGGWLKRLVEDPVAWRADYPAEANLPPVEAVRAVWEDGTLSVRFFASREGTRAAGGRSVLDVADWSVRAFADAPATWEVHPVAEAVPLLPPW